MAEYFEFSVGTRRRVGAVVNGEVVASVEVLACGPVDAVLKASDRITAELRRVLRGADRELVTFRVDGQPVFIREVAGKSVRCELQEDEPSPTEGPWKLRVPKKRAPS